MTDDVRALNSKFSGAVRKSVKEIRLVVSTNSKMTYGAIQSKLSGKACSNHRCYRQNTVKVLRNWTEISLVLRLLVEIKYNVTVNLVKWPSCQLNFTSNLLKAVGTLNVRNNIYMHPLVLLYLKFDMSVSCIDKVKILCHIVITEIEPKLTPTWNMM